MDLKSSNFVLCKHQASALHSYQSEVRLSSGPARSIASAFRSGLLGVIALFSLSPLLSTPGAFGQAAHSEATKATTRTELSASTLEGSDRTHATFTVKVSGQDNAATVPTGSVTFMDGDQALGAAFLDGDGQATLTLKALPAGMQKITAVYDGDGAHQASASEVTAVNSATTGVPAFTLSASAAALKVVAGQTATTLVTATPENGFNQAVSLSCSGAPYVSVTCVFTPITVTPGARTTAAPTGTPAASTLAIQTIAPSGVTTLHVPESGQPQTSLAMLIPGILALAGLGLAGRRTLTAGPDAKKILGILLLSMAGIAGLGGCSQRYGYIHKGPPPNTGTPVGTYTITISGITGTGSTLSTSSAQLTLTVTAQ